MKNIDSLIDLMLTSDDPDRAFWGTQLVRAKRYNFGKFNNLKKTVKPELLHACLNERKEIFHLPAKNTLFYCDDFLFIHVLSCDDGVMEARAAVKTYRKKGFYQYPVCIKVSYDKNEMSHAPFMGCNAGDEKSSKESADWLCVMLAQFFVILHDFPKTVTEDDIMDRSLSLEAVSIMTGITISELERTVREKNIPFTTVSKRYE